MLYKVVAPKLSTILALAGKKQAEENRSYLIYHVDGKVFAKMSTVPWPMGRQKAVSGNQRYVNYKTDEKMLQINL